MAVIFRFTAAIFLNPRKVYEGDPESGKSGFGDLLPSTAPQSLLNHPIDLKMVSICRMDNLYIHGHRLM